VKKTLQTNIAMNGPYDSLVLYRSFTAVLI